MTSIAALVLSGLDPTGGAGLLADVSIIKGEKVHAAGVPTALTVQTGKKVVSTRRIPRNFFRDSLLAQNDTFSIRGVKIGMVGSAGIVQEIYRFLRDLSPQWVVLDPVLFSSYGTPLISDGGLKLLKKIVPLCSLITPNWLELKILSSLFGIGGKKKDLLCRTLSEVSGTSVLLTGGQEKERGTDYLFHRGGMITFSGKAVRKGNFHGTGCALSSLILANLIKGHEIEKSIEVSKRKLEKHLLSGFRSSDGRWFMGG
ncbi:MAG: hypothetical protein GTO08_09170 [Deltaproteobacteria bacterium]|nr:hypothetical protein [Deltaproteobacteria bacterium]